MAQKTKDRKTKSVYQPCNWMTDQARNKDVHITSMEDQGYSVQLVGYLFLIIRQNIVQHCSGKHD